MIVLTIILTVCLARPCYEGIPKFEFNNRLQCPFPKEVQVLYWCEECQAYCVIMDCCMIFCYVITQVGGAGLPLVAELTLTCSTS